MHIQAAAPPPQQCPPADLQSYNEELYRRVLSSPVDCLPPFEEALEEMIRNQHQKVRSLRAWQCVAEQCVGPGQLKLRAGGGGSLWCSAACGAAAA